MSSENTVMEDEAFLIRSLSGDVDAPGMPVPDNPQERWRLLRSIMNVRGPMPVDPSILRIQDRLLSKMAEDKGIVDADDLEFSDGICLWRGDITRLRCDAIVNAANNGMMGCFVPCHSCIDNVIHTFAGMQLRSECAEIMNGDREPVGGARITGAYNLPCKHILHTVGPTVEGELTERHCVMLKSCYRSCLELARDRGLGTVAFCCISTGVFGFPQREAAEIAVDTVRGFLRNERTIRVIFDVFTDRDESIYDELLG